jgi:REP element-mobilizing transposase RayT
MPKPRSRQISIEATPYYHCMSRCVRRAFLCGTDPFSSQNYEHRRGWIETKLLELGQVFAIDICAYAVMSNHYHVVLHIDHESANHWSVKEVISRWHALFSGNVFSQHVEAGVSLSKAEREALDRCVEQWRKRLMDISWFMRVLNEHIARMANAEDNCTGRFWEGRFKSQALLDEKALAACLAYVDLNPIRATLAKTPEQSDFTSVQRRMNQAKQTSQPNTEKEQASGLMPFVGHPRQDMPKGLPFLLTDYLELVDWTGRIIREDKHGFIPQDIPPILNRLQIEPKEWLYLSKHFESPFKGLVGSIHKLKQVCAAFGLKRTPGLSSCKALFT